VLKEAKEVKRDLDGDKNLFQEYSEMEESCGSPMFCGEMMGSINQPRMYQCMSQNT
jgi:hypothetical protein